MKLIGEWPQYVFLSLAITVKGVALWVFHFPQ